jgi:hypothetical protein
MFRLKRSVNYEHPNSIGIVAPVAGQGWRVKER